jgi:putative aminopeptidase FrvX
VPPAKLAVLLVALLAAAGPLAAQSRDSLVHRMAAMSAVTGFEDAMADSLLAMPPGGWGAARDRAGNVVWTRGGGDPVRLGICPMDEIGYVVGSVTAEGYLTLRRVGGTPMGALYDQALEGQRVTVFGRRGAVPGVVGVRSTHLTRGRPPADEAPFPLDHAFVDVGAANAAGVTALGLDVLAPVTRAKLPHRYGAELLAGSWVGQRAACAALVAAARASALNPATGTTVIAFTARRHFNHDGTAFVLWQHPTAEAVLLGSLSAGEPGSGPLAGGDTLNAGGARRYVQTLALPARYARTPVETISLTDVAALEQRLVAWLGGTR